MGICDKLKKDEFYLMEVVMAEESSQQFTSTGNMSASSATVGKSSSVPPVRQASIGKSSASQTSQTRYVYAGIGEQPLTQREFDENLKNLRNILSECDSLLQGDMKNPKNVKRCQQLLGFATSLRLPQEVKDKEIRSYPPVVQQLYQSVKNEGSAVSTASQMAMAKQTATTMAQVINSDLRHEAILKDLQTMNIDAVYDKYYGAQHEQDMIAMAESHQKFMDLLDMPVDTPEQRAEFERKATAQLEEEKRRHDEENERIKREWEEIQRIKLVDPERGTELERKFKKNLREKGEALNQQNQELEVYLQSLPENDPRRLAVQKAKVLNSEQIGIYNRVVCENSSNNKTEQKQQNIPKVGLFPLGDELENRFNVGSQKSGSSSEATEVHKVVADAPAAQRAEDISSNLNGVGRVAIRSRAQINNTEPSGLEQPSATDALASMGKRNTSDDLNFGIVPGGSIGTTSIKPAGRSKGFKRGGIAGTNRTFDLGTIGLASTTAPKLPEKTTEKDSITTERAATDNSIATADNRSSESRMADLTAISGAKKENPLGKPLDLEETSDINLLTVRSQQSQAMA